MFILYFSINVFFLKEQDQRCRKEKTGSGTRGKQIMDLKRTELDGIWGKKRTRFRKDMKYGEGKEQDVERKEQDK